MVWYMVGRDPGRARNRTAQRAEPQGGKVARTTTGAGHDRHHHGLRPLAPSRAARPPRHCPPTPPAWQGSRRGEAIIPDRRIPAPRGSRGRLILSDYSSCPAVRPARSSAAATLVPSFPVTVARSYRRLTSLSTQTDTAIECA